MRAQAANRFFDSLIGGSVSEAPIATPVLERGIVRVPGSIAGEEEERTIQACREWVIRQGLPAGEYMYELTDGETGSPLAVLDLAWPDGLQERYSQPVALLLDEDSEMEEIANRAGYLFSTDVDNFQLYVQKEILAPDDEVA